MTRTRKPTHHRLRRAAALAAVGASFAALAAPVLAASPLSWSAASLEGASTLTGTSCPSEALCVSVDRAGHAFASTDPGGSPPSWSGSTLAGSPPLAAVSCTSPFLCVAVDANGESWASSNAAAGASSWTHAPTGATALTGVSCTSASLCVAVDDAGEALSTERPFSGAQWSSTVIDPGRRLLGVSCSSASLCVAVDNLGGVLASNNPTGGAFAWHRLTLDPEHELLAVSCSTGLWCVAVDGAGSAFASQDPAAATPTWSATPIDSGNSLTAVSCATSGLCVAVDSRGTAFASDSPVSATPNWSASNADSGTAIDSISCLPGGFCVASDSTRALSGRLPAPEASTAPPSVVTSTGATLAGVVNPNDAVLGACRFEYGTGLPYTGGVPCAVLPAALSGPQIVSAEVAGLLPNTLYHYRVLAASAVGTTPGADTSFITAVSSGVALVYPHPSVSGTPASGQRLTCHPGTPAEAVAQLSYAWLRDLIPIASASSSTYTIRDIDTGHHLQCQVTAKDAGGQATAASAFLNVPAQRVPAATGETTVGRARYSRGRVSVPVSCSAHASVGCSLSLRLSAVETRSGRRVVAVTANEGVSARSLAAALRRSTVLLASARTRLARGERRTVVLTLNAAGRRLVAARHLVPANLAASGTVIGVIQAALSSQTVRLGAAGAHRARQAARDTAGTHAAHGAGRAPAARPAQVRGAASQAVSSATPYMGWDTYFAFGGRYSESTVLTQASELISTGLAARGYRYVWLDAGWWHGTRAANGEITVSSQQWPHGMGWLARTLHAAGLRVGLYTDAGLSGCGGGGQGSYGHYKQDANTFAAWAFDAVKVDFCGGAEDRLDPAGAYSSFHAALAGNSSHRQMLLSICNFLQPGQYAEGEPSFAQSAFSSYTFGQNVGTSWRTDTDVGLPGHVSFAEVLRNMDADAAQPQAAGPGHWNDPDYLGPDQGMSPTQFRSQMSMWAMLAAPLMISDNLTAIGAASRSAVSNSEVIAIDQDPAGMQGTLTSSTANAQVWVRPLVDGSRAVALLNRGGSALRIHTSAAAVGEPTSARYVLRNVWTHSSSFTNGAISAEVPANGTVLLRVATA